MQNRRDNLDDWRGMGEPLQESNSLGVGISVPATYYVQLFNPATRKSLQRTIQQRQDAPAQSFFNFEASPMAGEANSAISSLVTDGWNYLLTESGFTSEMKLELFTLGRNSLLMRVENIADTFDNAGEVSFQTVQLQTLVDGLYTLANGPEAVAATTITEMSLTGNQAYADMAANKVQWATVDDEAVVRQARVPKDTAATIELQQQRIRVFKVDYSPNAEAFLQ